MWEKISKQSIQNILAVITVVGCFILLYIFTMKEIPAGNKDIVIALGSMIFGAGAGGVFGFYFGASKTSSAKKDINNES